VRHEQAVERVARPREVAGRFEPRRRRRIVEELSIVGAERGHARRPQPNPPGFNQEL